MVIEELSADTLRGALPELTEILEGCVAEGPASASWCRCRPARARPIGAGWRGAAGGHAAHPGGAAGGRIVATGALALGGLPNARHRAEVSKLLVHPRRGARGWRAPCWRRWRRWRAGWACAC
ncbi:hypothetical protein ACFFMP_05815 [Pseudoroseomonas cervicalis]|uniref:hypothetical protein n=1 Tax=Teichococcus cervicalis TaxID=204525 RepID=UPI0035E4AA53